MNKKVLLLAIIMIFIMFSVCKADDVIIQPRIGTDPEISPPDIIHINNTIELPNQVNPYRILSPSPVKNPLLPLGLNQEWVIVETFLAVTGNDKPEPYPIGKAIKKILFSSLLNPDSQMTVEPIPEMVRAQIYIQTIVETLKTNGSEIIKVDLIDHHNNIIRTGYFMYWTDWELYSLYSNQILGLHIPYGLYGIYKRDDRGLPVAMLPVGLAWGIKKHYYSDFYLGFNIISNLACYSPLEPVSNQNPLITSATLGLYLDINNQFYLGYAYGSSFEPGKPNMGHILIIGIGPKVIGMLNK